MRALQAMHTERNRQAGRVVDTRMCCYTRTRSHVEAFGRWSSNRSDRYVLSVRPICGLCRLNQKSPSREGPRQGRNVLG
jgi:hypothetical protein